MLGIVRELYYDAITENHYTRLLLIGFVPSTMGASESLIGSDVLRVPNQYLFHLLSSLSMG